MAKFYGKARAVEQEYYLIEDILLNRYGDGIHYILNKDSDIGFKSLKIAIEKQQENKLWDIYVARSIFADSSYPDWATVLKDSKKMSENVKTKNNIEVKKTVQTAIKMFKGGE